MLGDDWPAPGVIAIGIGGFCKDGGPLRGVPAPAPCFRNAETDGASLMGVPTVGVEACTSAPSVVGSSSVDAAMGREVDVPKGLALVLGDSELGSERGKALRTSEGPKSASACAGSYVRHQQIRRKERKKSEKSQNNTTHTSTE